MLEKKKKFTSGPQLHDIVVTQVPSFVHKYIANGHNVKSDGNCGYRTVAVQLGKSEEEWRDVRRDCQAEILENQAHYEEIANTGNEGEVVRMLSSVNWFEAKDAGRDHWMYFPEFGHVLANRYGQPVHFYSPQMMLTFLRQRMGLK